MDCVGIFLGAVNDSEPCVGAELDGDEIALLAQLVACLIMLGDGADMHLELVAREDFLAARECGGAQRAEHHRQGNQECTEHVQTFFTFCARPSFGIDVGSTYTKAVILSPRKKTTISPDCAE